MGNEPYIICCDLDGTLLTSSKEITPYTRAAVAEARAKGHRFCIVTGRPPVMAGAYYAMLDLDTPVISHSGSVVWLPGERRVLLEQHVPKKAALDYTDFCTEEGLDWALFTFDAVYYPASDDRHIFYSEYNELARTWQAPELTFRSGLTRRQAEELLDQGVYRISVVRPTEKQMNRLESYFPQHPEMAFVHSTRTSYDALPPGVNKWQGILAICDYFGADPSRVVAFGNDVNDIEMICNAGQGFMVENSEPQLLVCKATLIGSNDADGVAHAIRSFVLKD